MKRTMAIMIMILTGFGFSPNVPGADFDGDGKDDIAVFRESSGLWAVRGVTWTYFGTRLDIPVPGDYGGGNADEIAIFRPSSGLWAAQGVTRVYFGADGDIPLSQSGLKESTNFFYDPVKYAFRAGQATGSQWNGQSVGEYSVAMGYSTIASGLSSTAMGYYSKASGNYSTAMGLWTTASGDYSTAMGHGTTASSTRSTTMGYSTTASGLRSTAMGTYINVSGDDSFGYGTFDSFGVDVSADKVFVIHGAKVGIGTTSPGTRFSVAGLTGTASYNNVRVDTSTGDFYYSSSSRRFKDEIRDLEGDFHRILEAEPKKYLDRTSGQAEIGYIAEDFDENGLQELVIYDGENRPNGLKYERISLYLVEVIKEQQQQISAQNKQISTQSRQISSLENRIARLEKEEI